MVEEKLLVLTPFTERGYSKLAGYLWKSSRTTYLPIPREICLSTTRSLFVHKVPSSYLRVWEPVLELIDRGDLVFYECYASMSDIAEAVSATTRLLTLVLKARVFGKLSTSEWLSALPSTLELHVSEWRGILVVDRFVNYYLLAKRTTLPAVVYLDTFAPTPLDLALLLKQGYIEWKCNLEEALWWVVRYIGDIVIPSTSLTEAHEALVKSREYREFIEKCAPHEVLLHYWLLP